jgi:hypothetical protein
MRRRGYPEWRAVGNAGVTAWLSDLVGRLRNGVVRWGRLPINQCLRRRVRLPSDCDGDSHRTATAIPGEAAMERVRRTDHPPHSGCHGWSADCDGCYPTIQPTQTTGCGKGLTGIPAIGESKPIIADRYV